ncbi:hypothetical protein [Rickettsia oklahomensis]|uniref:Uncharacterized protein n=1 Tax=Rickettsia oklahomensis TaxID=3141789 RepID=A0AAU7BZF4_9RICK
MLNYSYIIFSGGSCEGFVIENILSMVKNKTNSWIYRTAGGLEVDFNTRIKYK